MVVLEQPGANTRLDSTTEQHAVRHDDRHHAFLAQEVEAVQQESEIGGGFRASP